MTSIITKIYLIQWLRFSILTIAWMMLPFSSICGNKQHYKNNKRRAITIKIDLTVKIRKELLFQLLKLILNLQINKFFRTIMKRMMMNLILLRFNKMTILKITWYIFRVMMRRVLVMMKMMKISNMTKKLNSS